MPAWKYTLLLHKKIARAILEKTECEQRLIEAQRYERFKIFIYSVHNVFVRFVILSFVLAVFTAPAIIALILVVQLLPDY